CSESTGSTIAPDAAARRMNRLPAHTRVSLLASATIAPRSAAARVGLSPAAPVIAPSTHSAGRCAASTRLLCPAAASIPVPPTAFSRSRRASASIRSPHKQAVARGVETATRQSEKGGCGPSSDEPVETVHEPAMTRDKMTGILHTEPALEAGFEEIPCLGDDG